LKTLRTSRTRGGEVSDVVDGPAELAELRAAIAAEVRAQLEREAQAKQRAGDALRQAGRRRRAHQDGQGSGPLPYGYMRAKGSIRTYEGDVLAERGDLVIDEAAARIVRRMFALHRAGFSPEDIAMQLTVVGTRTRRGGLWGESSVRAVLAHEELYSTGRRMWAGICASELWPIILRS
jgi:Recombinase